MDIFTFNERYHCGRYVTLVGRSTSVAATVHSDERLIPLWLKYNMFFLRAFTKRTSDRVVIIAHRTCATWLRAELGPKEKPPRPCCLLVFFKHNFYVQRIIVMGKIRISKLGIITASCAIYNRVINNIFFLNLIYYI